jgi:hypothetical protein
MNPSNMKIDLPDEIIKHIFDIYRKQYLPPEKLKFRFTSGQCFLLGKTQFCPHRSIIKIHGVTRYKPHENYLGKVTTQRATICFTLYYLNQLNNEILEHSSFKLPFISYLQEDDKLWSTEYCCKHLMNTGPVTMTKVMKNYIGYNNGIILSKYNCYYAYNLDTLLPIYDEDYLPPFIVTAISSMHVYHFSTEDYLINETYEFDKLFKALLTNWSFLNIYDKGKGKGKGALPP